MALILEDIRLTHGLVLNAPTIFAREDFLAWLNDEERNVFTWHRKGPGEAAHEYSDTVVLVNENYDGDSSDMPEDIWNLICEEVYARYGGPELTMANGESITVRLTNLSH